MEEMYAPPFRMTEEITNLVIEIGECVGKISVSDAATKDPKLRRVNRMQTIHATLAIEQNALTLEQVTAVIQGKRVLAPPQDICEVKELETTCFLRLHTGGFPVSYTVEILTANVTTIYWIL